MCWLCSKHGSNQKFTLGDAVARFLCVVLFSDDIYGNVITELGNAHSRVHQATFERRRHVQ